MHEKRLLRPSFLLNCWLLQILDERHCLQLCAHWRACQALVYSSKAMVTQMTLVELSGLQNKNLNVEKGLGEMGCCHGWEGD